MKTIISEKRLRAMIEQMLGVSSDLQLLQEASSPFKSQSWFRDQRLRDCLQIYFDMQDPEKLRSIPEFQQDIGLTGREPVTTRTKVGGRNVDTPVMQTLPPSLGGVSVPVTQPVFDLSQSPRTSRTRGDIAANIFNKIRYLHVKSRDLFAGVSLRNVYAAVESGVISPPDASIINSLDQKIRQNLNRPEESPLQTAFDNLSAAGDINTEELGDLAPFYNSETNNFDTSKLDKEIAKWPFKQNVFGKTKALQVTHGHDKYCYNANKAAGPNKSISESEVIRAYRELGISDPGQAYHFIMSNCQLPTGDDVEIAIAHFVFLAAGKEVIHIDATGTDLLMDGEIKIECKSSKDPNTIEKGLSASFPEDNEDKYYFFISNRGKASTQLSIVNSKLLRFVLLISDITNSPELDPSDPDVQKDYENKVLNSYVTKFGNNATDSESDFSWIRETIMNNSQTVLDGFIQKTTLQFQRGNAEDFDDTVTFRVGNAKVMVRTQVNWGLSEEDMVSNDDEDTDDDTISEALYNTILKDIMEAAIKKRKSVKRK